MGKRITVLIEVTSSDTRIGAVNDALDLCRYGMDEGMDFILCGPVEDRLRTTAEALGFRVLSRSSMPISMGRLPAYALDVIRWMRVLSRIRPDVLHLNYVSWGPSLACAGRIMGIPVLARAGGGYSARNPSSRWVCTYLANCEAQAAHLLDSPLRNRVAVVGDLVNMDRMSAIGSGASPGAAYLGEPPTVLFLGQLVERKGLHILVQAFERMHERAHLFLVGGNWDEGDYPATIRQLALAGRSGARVHLLNHRQDALTLLRECDVFVLPSLSEARPRVVIEAMILGKCVVATRTGGLPSLIEEGVTGVLVPPGDVAALASVLDDVIRDGARRRELGMAAQRRAAVAFDPRATVRNYLREYTRALTVPRH